MKGRGLEILLYWNHGDKIMPTLWRYKRKKFEQNMCIFLSIVVR